MGKLLNKGSIWSAARPRVLLPVPTRYRHRGPEADRGSVLLQRLEQRPARPGSSHEAAQRHNRRFPRHREGPQYCPPEDRGSVCVCAQVWVRTCVHRFLLSLWTHFNSALRHLLAPVWQEVTVHTQCHSSLIESYLYFSWDKQILVSQTQSMSRNARCCLFLRM